MKGQATMIGIIFTVIALVVFFFSLPLLEGVIESISPDLDPTTALLVKTTPVLLFFVILSGLVYYLYPRQQNVG